MPYEDQAEEHERLTKLLFTLQRQYEACAADDLEQRRQIRQAMVDVGDALERIRRRHRGGAR